MTQSLVALNHVHSPQIKSPHTIHLYNAPLYSYSFPFASLTSKYCRSTSLSALLICSTNFYFPPFKLVPPHLLSFTFTRPHSPPLISTHNQVHTSNAHQLTPNHLHHLQAPPITTTNSTYLNLLQSLPLTSNHLRRHQPPRLLLPMPTYPIDKTETLLSLRFQHRYNNKLQTI